MGSLFSSEVDFSSRPTVVIVGAGYAGCNIARRLDTKVNVVIIERRNHYFWNLGALRPVAQPETLYKTLVPYDRFLQNGAFIQGQVESISPTEIKLIGIDETIKFDYVIIATGSSYPFPMKHQYTNATDIIPLYKECSNFVEKANDIVIVGGGAVGIELLGEIGYIYPSKNITLIQSNEKILVGSIKDELRTKILDTIKEKFKNCKVITGERLDITNEMKDELKEANENNKSYLTGRRVVETSKGTKLDADIVFFATGTRLVPDAYKEHFGNVINPESQRIKCKPTMQVEGHDNVFAIGDCADMGPLMAAVAGDYGEAPIVENNIMALVDEKPDNMKEFPPPPPFMVLPLGPEEGASQLPMGGGMIFGSRVTSMLKGAGLFYKQTWNEMGYKEMQEEITTLTPKDINANLTDEQIEILANGVKIDITRFKQLLNGAAATAGVNKDKDQDKDENKDKNEAQNASVNDDVVVSNNNNGVVEEEEG